MHSHWCLESSAQEIREYSFSLSVRKSLSRIDYFFLHLKAIFMDFIRTSISVGHALISSLPVVYGLIMDWCFPVIQSHGDWCQWCVFGESYRLTNFIIFYSKYSLRRNFSSRMGALRSSFMRCNECMKQNKSKLENTSLSWKRRLQLWWGKVNIKQMTLCQKLQIKNPRINIHFFKGFEVNF